MYVKKDTKVVPFDKARLLQIVVLEVNLVDVTFLTGVGPQITNFAVEVNRLLESEPTTNDGRSWSKPNVFNGGNRGCLISDYSWFSDRPLNYTRLTPFLVTQCLEGFRFAFMFNPHITFFDVTEPRFCMFCGLVLRAMNSFAYGDHSSQKFGC